MQHTLVIHTEGLPPRPIGGLVNYFTWSERWGWEVATWDGDYWWICGSPCYAKAWAELPPSLDVLKAQPDAIDNPCAPLE